MSIFGGVPILVGSNLMQVLLVILRDLLIIGTVTLLGLVAYKGPGIVSFFFNVEVGPSWLL